jgi:hypothetical protein
MGGVIDITPDMRAAIRRMLRHAVFTPRSDEYRDAVETMQQLLPSLVDSLSDEAIDRALRMALSGSDIRP